MSEAKQKELRLSELRSGRYICVYCGERALTVDHVPPRAAFNNDRPRGLEFPSCDRCNDATRELDIIVGWLAQVGSWENPRKGDHLELMLRTIQRRFPEFATSFRRASPRLGFTPAGLLAAQPLVELTVDEYFHSVVTQFGLKFALAMHWKTTGEVASDNHRIAVFSAPNQDARPGSIPFSIYQYFSDRHYLVQGQKNSKGRFSYSSGSTADKSVSGQLATVGLMFSCVSFVVAPEFADRLDHSSFPQAKIFHRKQIQKSYPYGLRRLTSSEILFRLSTMDTD